MNTRVGLVLNVIIACLFSLQATAQTPNSAYVVQPNDWLSSISKKAYGNPHLYNRIVEGTNTKAKTDNSFRRIDRPNSLQEGQKLWIPALPSQNLAGVPVSNCEIRLWYNYQVVAIGKINEKWINDGLDLETRAHKAYELRHNARLNSRFMMQNKEEVKALQARDIKEYGNPDGPTFEYLLQKAKKKGLSGDQALQYIIDGSSRTDSKYNADCQ